MRLKVLTTRNMKILKLLYSGIRRRVGRVDVNVNLTLKHVIKP
jgi:hypothetical protein